MIKEYEDEPFTSMAGNLLSSVSMPAIPYFFFNFLKLQTPLFESTIEIIFILLSENKNVAAQ